MTDIYSDFNKLITDRFPQFMMTDDTSTNKDFCKESRKTYEVNSYQAFPGEYLKDHRGLLLDHGLGSGKTRTAVNTIKALGRDTVVLVPASLHGNFSGELKRVQIPEVQVYFLHYNAGNLVAQYEKIGQRSLFERRSDNKFSGKLIIIEECHIFFQNVISGKAQVAIEIFDRLMKAENIKILCLSGTPITGDPFETVPLFNLLRGYLYEESSKKKYTLFPEFRQDFYRDFVSDEFNSIKNKDVFQDRITGLVSYYRGILDPDYDILPKINDMKVIECPMGTRQWIAYYETREEEWNYERFAKYKTTAFKEGKYKKAERASAGTYKTNSAQACNFAFPELVEKKFASQVSNYGKPKEISDFKWKLLNELFEDPFGHVYKNLADYSGKLAYLVPLLISPEKKGMKLFVYTKFQIVGAMIVAKMLEQAGYEQVFETDFSRSSRGIGSNPYDEKKPRFMVIDGTVKDPYLLINYYNREENQHGEYCQIIIGTSVMQAGVSLFDMREGYCLEAQWRSNILVQVKGRMIRTCSHERLPKEEREVSFYLLVAVPPRPDYRGKLSIDGGKTTDEMLYELSLRKAELCDTFVQAMHESAVDCYMNRAHNGEIDCRQCMNDIPVPIIPADYKVHLVNGSKCTLLMTRTTLIDYFDPDTGMIFKKDDTGGLYLLSEETGKYTEVGFIKDGKIILNEYFN